MTDWLKKYEAIWVDGVEGASSTIIFERYLDNSEKLHVIFQKANDCFLPYSFIKENDPQWCLPIWSAENEKALMPTLDQAKEYLLSYCKSNH